ncbi:Mor transcription activator family protein [Pectobacterium sp. IFB5596]|uniref:Mor transcription activator family protein n=1 Tax=Pectobacterium sp. IFB5596 TaxID=1839803 RepID=UPI001F26538A|nr:Mor transcription activator family protein [Pectobacterium sp. IFB5596]MCE9733916.1 hypothetical protein [Pectobacterium sp. IFB5596]GKW13525.1 hypothetical protein PEC301899_38070 [Pectobacterium carotovorum subsp. carotovorum]
MYKSPMAVKRHKLYEELGSHIITFAKGKGFSDEDAGELSSDLIKTLASLFGGQNITFPLDINYDLKKRDRLIYQEFCGSMNCWELAKKYGMSERSIYKIISRVRKDLAGKK